MRFFSVNTEYLETLDFCLWVAGINRRVAAQFMTPSAITPTSETSGAAGDSSVCAGPEINGGWLQTVLMAAVAIFVGVGVQTNSNYTSGTMVLLTCGLLCCLAALWIGGKRMSKPWGGGVLLAVLALGIAVQCTVLINDRTLPFPDVFVWPFKVRLAAAGILGMLGVLRSPVIRSLRLILLALIFCILAYTTVRVFRDPVIDVFTFQMKSVQVLLDGRNPFSAHQAKFPNIYPPEATSFVYGPGVVDITPTVDSPYGTLRHGFPYLPMSLLLAIPGQVLGGDIRYSDVVAIVLSALLMVFARPGRHGGLAACLFLFAPPVFYVVARAWTEPLLVFTFSLAMFCACRWPRMLPYALGIFLATKQYTVLLVPLTLLLAGRTERPWKDTLVILLKAFIPAALVTLPFVFWNFHEFWGSVVKWQMEQPFRMDSSSYLVTAAGLLHGWHAPFYTAFVFVIPAIGLVLWRGARTPAGFAAGTAFVCLVFFLFNKQAFTNYYYFVIGAACWAVAAAEERLKDEG